MLLRNAFPSPHPATTEAERGGARERLFLVASAVAVAALAICGLIFQYRGALGEPDLYWVVAGLLDGHANGQGARSPMQYGASFSFGYFEILYALLSDAAFSRPERVMAVINAIGLVSTVTALLFLVVAVTARHGARVAFVTAALFGLSPMVLDLATSGHPVLPSLAAYGLGVALMSFRSAGLSRLLLWTLAGLAFLAGLAIRAEIIIALGWPVVMGADTGSLGRFLRSASPRAVPAGAAVAAFFVLQAGYIEPRSGGAAGTLLGFMQSFYSLGQIGKGVAYLAIGSGVATLALAAVAAVAALRAVPDRAAIGHGSQSLFRSARFRRTGFHFGGARSRDMRPRLAEKARQPDDSEPCPTAARSGTAAAAALLLEPAALILPCLVLWLPNPNPARHFLFALLGIALFVGLVLRWTNLRAARVLLLVPTVIVANQLIGELSRPMVIRALNSPYLNFPDQPRTLTQAPLGALWVHNASLRRRRAAWDEEAARLRDLCDRQVIVLADDPMQMALALFQDARAPSLAKTKLGPFDAISATRSNGQTFLFVPRYPYWPRDVVADILALPALTPFAILDVALSRSVHDRTPVPRERIPKAACEARSSGVGNDP